LIRITKPRRAPEVLRTKGAKTRDGYCRDYAAHQDDYDRGKRTFEFDGDIYGHKSVKEALIRAQHDKCCFCESKVTHVAYGDVEHFRPKKGFRQKRSDKLGRPGYYWLAYEWSNLFFSCQLCNQRYKANLFPLVNPNGRALCHADEIANEKPLFVNPCEDPEDHISFQRELAVPLRQSRMGRTTINTLGLNRPRLQERRKDRHEELRILRAVAEADPPMPETEDAKAKVAAWQTDAGEYASMVRCAVADGFGGS